MGRYDLNWGETRCQTWCKMTLKIIGATFISTGVNIFIVKFHQIIRHAFNEYMQTLYGRFIAAMWRRIESYI